MSKETPAWLQKAWELALEGTATATFFDRKGTALHLFDFGEKDVSAAFKREAGAALNGSLAVIVWWSDRYNRVVYRKVYCTVCHGTGWLLDPTAQDDFPEQYDGMGGAIACRECDTYATNLEAILAFKDWTLQHNRAPEGWEDYALSLVGL